MPAPPLNRSVVHQDTLARVERIDLAEPLRVRAETPEGFTLSRKSRTQETTLTTRNRIVTLRTKALFIVHTRLNTFICAEDASVNGKMLILLSLEPQEEQLSPEALLHFVNIVRYAEITPDTEEDIFQSNTQSPAAPGNPEPERKRRSKTPSAYLTPEELDPPLTDKASDPTKP